MLDLPDAPLLDKRNLIGGCLRLPLRIDAERIRAEVEALSPGTFDGTGQRIGVHRVAQAVFLRGYAPAEGDKPIEDRPLLALLPYVRSILSEVIPAPVQRGLLARLPGGAAIAFHRDQAPYFAKTIRIHIPIITHPAVWTYCSGKVYAMAPGEVWALNNSEVHGVWNVDPEKSRTHLICDFLLSEALRHLLIRGDRDLGQVRPDIEHQMAAVQRPAALGVRP